MALEDSVEANRLHLTSVVVVEVEWTQAIYLKYSSHKVVEEVLRFQLAETVVQVDREEVEAQVVLKVEVIHFHSFFKDRIYSNFFFRYLI